MHLIDITRPIRSGMPVWPGDAPCCLLWTSRIADEEAANVSELRMSAHAGTHADGAYHVMDGAPRIGAASLEAFIGPAFVTDVSDGGEMDEAWAAELLARAKPDRLLVRTGCWTDPDVFPTRFAAPTAGAAAMLVDAGLRLFGTDAPSVDPFYAEELDAHVAFCGAGVAILENLLLDGVHPGTYELIAFPLRLEEADASPVRAVLRGA
jgi:arylformamidase